MYGATGAEEFLGALSGYNTTESEFPSSTVGAIQAIASRLYCPGVDRGGGGDSVTILATVIWEPIYALVGENGDASWTIVGWSAIIMPRPKPMQP